MNALVIGSGAREHAICHKLLLSKDIGKLFCAKGNAGTANVATNINIDPLDFRAIANFCHTENIQIVVVGPEVPLSKGIVDFLEKENIKTFGPNKKGALIEASKAFCKNLCKKYSIPQANYEIFDEYSKAMDYIENQNYPLVIKADGLAAGKGVTVTYTPQEAKDALKACFIEKNFGSAGTKVVIEEFLDGEELSYMVFCDGKNFWPLLAAQDHKRVFDNDTGPNTGGMGAYAKAPIIDSAENQVKELIQKTIHALISEGIIYKGVLYAGLMVKDGKPYILEYNCRFGDPETQCVLPLLKTDLLELMLQTIEGKLDEARVEFLNEYAISVVLASAGYPGDYEKHKEITGLEAIDSLEDVLIFHAGTTKENAKIYTSGGRVLNVVAKDKDFQKAIEKAYNAARLIHFDGMHYRKDIGKKALKYLKNND